MLTNNPRINKGDIALNSDFPTLALVQVNWTYYVTVTVTDNDPACTNTGQILQANTSIYWNGTGWNICAPCKVWEAVATAIAITSPVIQLNPGQDRFEILASSTAGGSMTVQAYIGSAWKDIATIPIAAGTAEAENFWYYVPQIRIVFTPAAADTVSLYIYNSKVN